MSVDIERCRIAIESVIDTGIHRNANGRLIGGDDLLNVGDLLSDTGDRLSVSDSPSSVDADDAPCCVKSIKSLY